MKSLLILSTLIVFGLTATISAQSETKSDETKVETETYIVEGMTCQGCVNSVEKKLGNIEGVEKYEVSLENGEAVVEYDPKKIKSEDIENDFESSPYKVTLKESSSNKKKE